MPYIKPKFRDTARRNPMGAGELNYNITKTVDEYLANNHQPVGYAAYNEVIGVLECVKLELYRRCVAPYEDVKCAENGDVYGHNKE